MMRWLGLLARKIVPDRYSKGGFVLLLFFLNIELKRDESSRCVKAVVLVLVVVVVVVVVQPLLPATTKTSQPSMPSLARAPAAVVRILLKKYVTDLSSRPSLYLHTEIVDSNQRMME